MSKLIIRILLIFVVLQEEVAISSSWFPVGKPSAITNYTSKSKCELDESQECFDVLNKELAYHDIVSTQVDDVTNPIYRNPDLSAVKLECSGFIDCSSKSVTVVDGVATSRVCSSEAETVEKWDEIANWPGVSGINSTWFIWCEKLIGYQQKTVKQLVENLANKTAFLAAQASKAQKEFVLKLIRQKVTCGMYTIEELLFRNATKPLTVAQSKAISDLYAPIKRLLETGSLVAAKAEIQAVVPDALTTQADKDAVLAALASCDQ